tara:strand:+ start:3623 stop:3874 length:252 start_codon:yes stop_codon:yes gene_type:complete
MSWVATAIISTAVLQVGTGALQRKASRKAEKRAAKDALEADKQARKAEVFAETEGEGQGSIAQISLEVDDELEQQKQVSTVRI